MGMVINPFTLKLVLRYFFLSDYSLSENTKLGLCVEMGNLEIIYKIKSKKIWQLRCKNWSIPSWGPPPSLPCFILHHKSYHCLAGYLFYLIKFFCFFSPTWKQGLWLFCLLLGIQYVRQCLTFRRGSINTCQMNEWAI